MQSCQQPVATVVPGPGPGCNGHVISDTGQRAALIVCPVPSYTKTSPSHQDRCRQWYGPCCTPIACHGPGILCHDDACWQSTIILQLLDCILIVNHTQVQPNQGIHLRHLLPHHAVLIKLVT